MFYEIREEIYAIGDDIHPNVRYPAVLNEFDQALHEMKQTDSWHYLIKIVKQ